VEPSHLIQQMRPLVSFIELRMMVDCCRHLELDNPHFGWASLGILEDTDLDQSSVFHRLHDSCLCLSCSRRNLYYYTLFAIHHSMDIHPFRGDVLDLGIDLASCYIPSFINVQACHPTCHLASDRIVPIAA